MLTSGSQMQSLNVEDRVMGVKRDLHLKGGNSLRNSMQGRTLDISLRLELLYLHSMVLQKLQNNSPAEKDHLLYFTNNVLRFLRQDGLDGCDGTLKVNFSSFHHSASSVFLFYGKTV